MRARTASFGLLFLGLFAGFAPNNWPSFLGATYEHLQANILLPPTRGEWFRVAAGRRNDCNTKEQGNMGGPEINLTLGISLIYAELSGAGRTLARSEPDSGRPSKESAPLGWEDFEKLIFYPVTQNPERICVCSPGFVSPMRGHTWLGAALVLGAQLRALWLAAAVEVHTAKEVVAVNGTNQRLRCTFSSSSPVSQQLSVSWNFQPEDLSSHELVFYYQKEPYKPPSGRFKDRVTWDGNIERNDVSIMIWNLQPSDNGTFTCQVTNWPDVYGTIGEVRLRVVQKVTFSEIHFLAVAIGSASVLMVIVVTAVFICRQRRRRARDKRLEVADTEGKEKESLKMGEEKEPVPLED